MQKKFLELIYNLSVAYKKTILIIMAIITIACVALIPGLKISSSHQNLIATNHPEQAKYMQFLKDFGAADNLVVVLDGDMQYLEQAADLFAQEIRKETTWVNSIFFKIDPEFFIKKAPLFIPLPQLQEGAVAVKRNRKLIEKLARADSLASLLTLLQSELRNPNKNISAQTASGLIDGLHAFFAIWRQNITDPGNNDFNGLKLQLPQVARAIHTLQSGGYLFSHDFKMLYLFVQPTSSNDELDYLRPFIAAMRRACDRVFVKRPELKQHIKVAFTGMPAHVLTENETIISDVGKAGIISIVLVILILLYGFKSPKKMIIGVIPLLCGMLITLGVIRLTVGRLNLISSSFLAVLFGIGIDFGIYLMRRAEEELGNGLSVEESVRRAVVITGKGILTGGLTTAMAFLAIAFSDFSGYSELGITAGAGILIVLAVTFLLMPALLLTVKIEPRQYVLSKDLVAHNITPARKKTIMAILIPSLLFGLFSIYAATKTKMDYNVLNLLPKNTESTEYQKKMEEKSDFQMSFAAITTGSLDELKTITGKVKQLTEVSRIDSLGELIPDHQQAKIALLKQYNSLLRLPPPGLIRSANRSQYIQILGELSTLVENLQDTAFSGGQTELVKKLDNLNKSIQSIQSCFSGQHKTAALQNTRIFEKNIFSLLTRLAAHIPGWLKVTPVREKDLPELLVKRFKNRDGRYVAYVFPNGNMWDLPFLDRFVATIKKITANVTGFPVTHRVYVRQAADAVLISMFYSFAVILLILLLDFRNIRAVLLTLVPLATGMLWLQGSLAICKIPYNVANIAGLPLLLGLGVVYGVHIVHRWLENPHLSAHAAAQTSGRGVAFAAFTTISGLFSIAFARHAGVSTFGVVLLLGISLCLFSALYLLPALIDLIFHILKKGNLK